MREMLLFNYLSVVPPAEDQTSTHEPLGIFCIQTKQAPRLFSKQMLQAPETCRAGEIFLWVATAEPEERTQSVGLGPKIALTLFNLCFFFSKLID